MPKKTSRFIEFQTEHKAMSYTDMINSLYSIRNVLVPAKVKWDYILKEDRVLMAQEIDSIVHALQERRILSQ